MPDRHSAPSDVIAPPSVAAIPVEGSDGPFPVNRVACIGRNHADHAVQVGRDPIREPPFVVLKSPAALVSDGVFPYPRGTSDVHHEVEVAVALHQGGPDIRVADALDRVWGYGVGHDVARRDLQGEAKRLGRPWEIGKSFDRCGPLVPAARIGHPTPGAVTLDVGGERRPSGDLARMIWSVPEMIAILSRYFALEPGDVITTGTPAGAGPVRRGDVLATRVEGVGAIEVRVP